MNKFNLKRLTLLLIAGLGLFFCMLSITSFAAISPANISSDIESIYNKSPNNYQGNAPSWMARVMYMPEDSESDDRRNADCTGMFLNENVVITAKHCFEGKPQGTNITDYKVGYGGGGSKDKDNSIYNKNSYIKIIGKVNSGDIAIVQLEKPFTYKNTGVVQPITSFPIYHNFSLSQNTIGKIMGYGRIIGKGGIPVANMLNKLMTGDVTAIDDELNNIIVQARDSIGAPGDSGGPLLLSPHNMPSPGKVVGVLHGSIGFNTDLYSSLNSNIMQLISQELKIAIFKEPFDGEWVKVTPNTDGKLIITYKGWGEAPEKITYRWDGPSGKNDRDSIVACDNNIPFKAEENMWRCDSIVPLSFFNGVKISGGVNEKWVSATLTRKGGLQTTDTVDFHASVVPFIRITQPISKKKWFRNSSVVYVPENETYEIRVLATPGIPLKFRINGVLIHCLNRKNDNEIVADNHGLATCEVNSPGKIGYNKETKLEVVGIIINKDNTVAIDTITYNVKVVPKPKITISNPRENDEVISPFDISGTYNISPEYFGKNIKATLSISTSNLGASGSVESYNIKEGDVDWSFNGDFTTEPGMKLEYTTTAKLFINDTVKPITTTSVTYKGESDDIKILEPQEGFLNNKLNFTYKSGDEIPLNGKFNNIHDDIICSDDKFISHSDAEKNNKDLTWQCPDIPKKKMGVYRVSVKYKKSSRIYERIYAVKDVENPIITAPLSIPSTTIKNTSSGWVVVAPEFMVKGTGEPNASIDVPVPTNQDCHTTVGNNGTWNCGLQNTPPDGNYTLIATQTTPGGSVLKATSSFIVKSNDEEIDKGGNGGEGNGGGMNGKTGGGSIPGTGAAPYIIFPVSEMDGILMGSAVGLDGIVGAVTGAVGSVGLSIVSGTGEAILHDLIPGRNGIWRYPFTPKLGERYTITVTNKDHNGLVIGSRILKTTGRITISSPEEGQIIPYHHNYSITGQAGPGEPVVAVAQDKAVCNARADARGQWSCEPSADFMSTTTGKVSITAMQNGKPETAAVRHYSVSVKPLTISSPMNGQTIIDSFYNFAGSGQTGTQVEISGDVSCKDVSCRADVTGEGFWLFPAQKSVPGTYTVQAVTLLDGKPQADKQSVTYTVSPLVTTPLSVDSPSENETVTQSTYRIKGKGKPGHDIDVTGIPVAGECHTTADANTGKWSCGPYEAMEKDEAQISVSDRDEAGTETPERFSRHYTLDPAFTVESPGENEVLKDAYRISGQAPAGSTVNVAGLGYAPDCTVKADASGVWSCPVAGIPYSPLQGIYNIRVRNIDESGNEATIMRHFAVNSGVGKTVNIIWPTENMKVNANDFMISGTTLYQTGHISVKGGVRGQTPSETLCETDVEEGLWSCKVHKENGNYDIQAFRIDDDGGEKKSEVTSFSVEPERAGSSGISIDSPVEGEIIRTPEYTISGRFTKEYNPNIVYSVAPGVCSGQDMIKTPPTWSCRVSSVPGKKEITARESAHGSHDDSPKRHYIVVGNAEMFGHQAK
ncbi:trypsin-like serine protease [Photorhabdus luminescens]|uniref:trypsin-like serine protease n=1 Tax=Photorhabdus luminescens TaxID=29488 RepID=UPI00223F6B12|nr:trypsin-like serine protease [Photorhabdus luminescens]MCW7761507.1 trypsin-like serine protease [Photorhabdus luminescens subsp. venezuelensis]